jgi:signal transduction histidine kinase/CheY-like chemotaxis protein
MLHLSTPSELLSALLPAILVPPDTTVMDAVARMSGVHRVLAHSNGRNRSSPAQTQTGSSCILVVEDDRFIGMITQRDVVELIAKQRDLDRLTVGDVMTSHLITLPAAAFTDLFVAIELLQQYQISHLPVVDDRNYPMGILTQASLQANLAEALAANVQQSAIQSASLLEQLQTATRERQQAQSQLQDRDRQLAISTQELTRATRLKDEFLASMNHELRTPLNAILGMSEALQASAFGSINDRQHHSISTIEKSGRQLLDLINDILDLSNIAANKFQLELTDVPIQSLCQSSLLSIEKLALNKQISVKLQLPEYLQQLNIQVDDRRCRQVLIDLLSNAVKFTPEGGSISLDVRIVDGGETVISTTTSQRRIAFAIVDSGIGIAPENISKLFQSFVQVDSTLDRQYAGTGLGLALVKQIVELHGGNVTVESTVNRGSCFTVMLPFDPSAKIVVPPSSLPAIYPLTPDLENKPTIKPKALILVVEDNDANMETMTCYLSSRGYRLAEARDGAQALLLLQECAKDPTLMSRPDLILMDIQMPRMDGLEATERIRQIPAYATIPIIALTALTMPIDQQKCLDAGADQYVTKPVKLGQLVSTIETILQVN